MRRNSHFTLAIAGFATEHSQPTTTYLEAPSPATTS